MEANQIFGADELRPLRAMRWFRTVLGAHDATGTGEPIHRRGTPHHASGRRGRHIDYA